jgi:hypothetical protein
VAASRGGLPHHGRRCASGTRRADASVAELADGGRRHCARVAEERRGVSGTGAVRRGGSDNNGGRMT